MDRHRAARNAPIWLEVASARGVSHVLPQVFRKAPGSNRWYHSKPKDRVSGPSRHFRPYR